MNETTVAAVQPLPEVRCPRCGKLLFKGVVQTLEMKCGRCEALVTLKLS